LSVLWSAVREILGLSIKGYRVGTVLVEGACDFVGSCYLAVAINPYTSNVVVMASAAGGVEIEEVARERPDAILRLEIPDSPDLLPPKAATRIGEFLARDLGLDPKGAKSLSETASRLYALYQKNDCQLAEINPLLVTAAGPVAADGKVVLDDNALYRQHGLLESLGIAGKRHDVSESTPRELRAAAAGFTYVDLLPEGHQKDPAKTYVGLVPGGAGYGIFSIDEVSNVGERHFDGRVVPVNFMDSGGGPTVGAVAEMFSLLMDYPVVDVILTSRFGGISSCDIFIRGLIRCLRDRHARGLRVLPVYGRMVGTDLAAGRAFLEKAQKETPGPLSSLSIVVGNQKIMADVIRDALTDFRKGARA
jgi:succinyl-CoA synthetase beta subunit